MIIKAECGRYIDDNCKCPVNPKAKTAEEVFDDYWIHGGPTRATCKKHFIKALESYADSVSSTMAEERVQFWLKNNYGPSLIETMGAIQSKGFSLGFRAGQERMRERAAKLGKEREEKIARLIDMGIQASIVPLEIEIRSLEVEEK